jgi:hypothetical protein
MKTVTLRLDRYSRIILTIIAVALVLIALKPLLPDELGATPQLLDVNIAEVGGGYVSYGTLTVEVENTVGVEVENQVDVNVTNPSLDVYDLNE